MSKKHMFLSVVSKITVFACVFCAFFISPVFATLPAGFTELEYIEGTGTQWIDTGYVLQSDDVVYQWIAKDTQPSGNTSLFGSEVGVQPKYAGILHGNRSSRNLYIGTDGGKGVGYNSDDSDFHSWILDMKSTGIVSLTKDGTVVRSTSWTMPIQKTKSIAVFANNGMSQITKAVFKSFTIIDNGQTKVNLIPARRESDNAIGMYDLVSNTFKQNSGSGTFVAGPVAEIKIATTKMVDDEFAATEAKLATTVQTIESVVSRTITQTGQIQVLQDTKQTRPDESCPANMKCLLVQDEDGTPHWYPIIEP